MSIIADFLLARIAEDGSAASYVHEEKCIHLDDGAYGEPCDCGRPARVLAECEAKRQIVAMYSQAYDDLENRWDEFHEGATSVLSDVVFVLVLPYADHPDFDRSWAST